MLSVCCEEPSAPAFPPKGCNADTFSMSQTGALALPDYPKSHFLLMEGGTSPSHKFSLLMIVLFIYRSESTDSRVMLGSQSKSGEERLWRDLQAGSSHLPECRYPSRR